jgi:guanylate kinase
MDKIRSIAMSAVTKPFDLHPTVRHMLSRYAEHSISHTLLYGPPGSGKWTLAKQFVAMHMQVPLCHIYRTKTHAHLEREKEHYYSKSTVHFEIDVRNFLPAQQGVMVNILFELAKTVNVVLNRYKIIMLRNAELICRSIQQQLRMMMESMYSTTRLVFVCSNIDRLDDTLLSRMVCVRVPSPPEATLLGFWRSRDFVEDDPSTVASVRQHIRSHNSNITQMLLQHFLTVPDEVTSLCNQIWLLLKRSNPMPQLHEIVQKSNTIHIPWLGVVQLLMTTRVLPRWSEDAPEAAAAIAVWNKFAYTYAQDQRKECVLEQLFCTLCLMFKHKEVEFEEPFGDWI